MNIKINVRRSRILALLSLASIWTSAQAAQPEAAFTYATRYNVAGQVTGTIAPDPDDSGSLRLLATRNSYNSVGQLEKVETGQLTSWADELVAPSSWGGYGFSSSNIFKTTEFSYDSYGRKIKQLVRGGDSAPEALVQYSYDSENYVRCMAVRMNKDNFLSPPADPCQPGDQGAQGPDRIFRYTNDIYGQVLQEERAVGTPLAQTYATTTYAMRSPTSYTDANGNKTVLTYDSYGRLSRRKFPLPTTPGGANESDYNAYTYDANGNVLTERKRSGATISFTTDALNRVTKKDLSDNSKGDDIEYDYDLRGLALHSRFASTPTIGVFNQFDGFGRLKQVNSVSVVGTTTASRVLQYAYDANGNRTQVKHPDNTSFNYTFDGLNRVNCVSEGGGCSPMDTVKLVTVEYRSDGKRNRLLRPGGATTEYAFNNANRLQSLTQDLSGSADDLANSFTYNPAGQIVQLTFGNSAFSPSGNFNRSGFYNVNGLNQYTSVTGSPMSYDSNGNLAQDAGAGSTFTYDMENRLVSMMAPAGGLKYDPLGRLAEYTAPLLANPIQFLYDGDALVAEYTVSGNSSTLTRRYVHGDQVDEPWVQYNGAAVGSSARRYLHADHLGSIVAQSSSSGANLGVKLGYDAYGIPRTTNYDRFGYTGQLWLKELGLNYYKARMYHPKLGRFLQTDPIFYADNVNMYAYVGGDPINASDPTGTTCFPMETGIGSVCAGPALTVTREDRWNVAQKNLKTLQTRVDNQTGLATPQDAANAYCILGGCSITEQSGFENGANIVPDGKDGFRLTDLRMGSESRIGIPFNSDAVADVHIHPASSRDGFSGGSIYSGGVRRDYEGDIMMNTIRPTLGFVFRAGDRAAWFYNSAAYLSAIQSANPGSTIDARRFIKRTR